MLREPLVPDDELKAGEEAEGDLETSELGLADTADAGDLGVRVGEVLEGLGGDAQPGEDETVDVAARDGDGALLDGEAVDVEGRGEVDGRAHGAELVQTGEVLGDGDGRLELGVEFPRDGAVLAVGGLLPGADDDDCRWCGVFGRFGRYRGFVLELDAVDGLLLRRPQLLRHGSPVCL